MTRILDERRGISADTALRLARNFGMTHEFWMDLHSDYKLRPARREGGELILRSVTPRAA